MFIFGFPIALGITAVKNGTFLHYLLHLACSGPGSPEAQIQPEQQQLLGALLFLACEPQQQLETQGSPGWTKL